MPDKNLKLVFEKLTKLADERMFGEVSLVFKNGEIVLIKTSKTEKITNGRTEVGSIHS